MDEFNFLTGRENPFLLDYEDYPVHQEVLSSLLELQDLAHKEIGAKLAIVSSFRDHARQTHIFNAKARGERKLLNDQGEELNHSDLSPKELLEAILRFSALPGASRHHWGTDIDVFDANKLSKKEVQLTPNECEKDGVFCELHEWLDEKIKLDQAFGFYRPYAEDLGGVAPEKWHLSFAPLAQEYFEKYTEEIFIQNLELSELELKKVLLENPRYYFERYFLRIHQL